MLTKNRIILFVAFVLVLMLSHSSVDASRNSSIKFEITIEGGLISSPKSGRLFVVMSPRDQAEPRLSIGRPDAGAIPMLARDVANFGHDKTETIDESAISFPIESLAKLPAGDYSVQALFDSNIDLKSVNAPGNLYSKAQRVHLDPQNGGTVKLVLNQRIPEEELPAESNLVKYVKVQSKLLTIFHGRPIFLRAGVILPRDFESQSSKRYPLRVRIGGYGTRFTAVERMMKEGSPFQRAWMADDTPRMVLLHLDGDGPFGDCYQVNSDNNGPYGDAVTQELIPYIEQKFHCIGQGWARVLDGGSTGGWVSLALQVFYPDFFNGTWSGFPDGVDFRAFQLINIYEDQNAYVNHLGAEQPSARDLSGEVRFTIRHECQMENVMGLGDSYTMSGQQWGAWNATYGLRGNDGRPVPLWDPRSGKIDRRSIEHWKKYDLRMVLENNWQTLAPKLRGKLTIWVGEADDYYLNNAVHLLDAFLSKANPPYEGKILYGPGKGHGWMPFSDGEIMSQMGAAIEKARR